MKNKEKTIVAIGAHHDDIELFCGGTLAKYGQMGWKIIYVVASTTPHYHPWPDEIEQNNYLSNNTVIKMRQDEATQGAAIIGADEVHFWNFRSLYWYKDNSHDRAYLDGVAHGIGDMKNLEDIPGREFILVAADVPAARDFVSEFLEQHAPEIVLTHTPDDESVEHHATSVLAFRAVAALLRRGKNVRLFGWEPGGGGTLVRGFAPTHYVDISDTIDVKCRAVQVFQSQVAEHDTSRFSEWCRLRAKNYGRYAGMEYAETFMRFNTDKCLISGWEKVQLSVTYDPANAIAGLDE